jgi:hypothetical protein
MAKPPPRPNAEKWRPTISDFVGIAGIVAAVIVYLTQPNWEIGSALALLAIALTGC